MELSGKKIVLGLSGGVACYKAAELCRALTKAGASVQVVMTDAASHFITAVTMQALSGHPVHTSQWDARIENNMAHIDLTRHADAILIAPCSADFMRKLAHGVCDDLRRPCAWPARTPAPAGGAGHDVEMCRTLPRNAMCSSCATTASSCSAGRRRTACGEVAWAACWTGTAADGADRRLQPKVLAGKRVLVTAGPTFEAIDPCAASPICPRARWAMQWRARRVKRAPR